MASNYTALNSEFTGAQLLKDIYAGSMYGLPNNSNAFGFFEFKGKLFFSANEGINGQELWISDGTTEGTQLLKDIDPGSLNIPYEGLVPSSSYPSNFVEFDSQLFFTANDGTMGEELWVSDGTANGTQLLKDINPRSVFGSYRPEFDGPSGFTEFEGKLFFAADDGTNGRELWVSDGTANGTQLLKDISPGRSYDPNSSSPGDFVAFDGKLFFAADDGINGRELWVSDGTANGTQLLKDINLSSSDSPSGSSPGDLIVFDDKLFFAADDGTNGRELWVSDGTTEGTQLLKDISPGRSYDPNSSSPRDFITLDGQLFFNADNGTNGNELWVSDGTTEGTQLFKDINPNDQGYDGVYNLTVAGDLLFFTASDGFTGQELWVSDGTSDGTLLFQDINPGPDSSYPSSLTVVGDQLFFSADDGVTGHEPRIITIPNNLVVGDESNNVLNGNAEADLISGFGGDDIIRGRGNDDTLNGASGDDVLFGGRGNDRISGGTGNDQIFGDRGDDELQGGAGDDVIEGGAGNDTVIVSNFRGVDSFDGGRGTDLIRFAPADNRDLAIFLERGNVGDGRTGGQFFDNFEQFVAGGGNDRLLGDSRSTLLDGGDGNDIVDGGAGRDTLIGGNGDDTITGGQGADILNGGIGDDVLVGDQGVDTFQFDRTLLDGESDADTILNFQARDVLDFADYLEVGASIDVIRITDTSLQIHLNREDRIWVFGTNQALDKAEAQIL